jgi:hypothetical protein
MDTLIFDADKSAAIDLPTLDRTIKLESFRGRTQLHPYTHADLLKKLVETSHKYTDYTPVIAPIIVKSDRCRRREWQGKDEDCPVENYVVDRLITKIDFLETETYKDDETARGEMSVALAYTEKGVQIGFGHKVRICQNMNIYGDRIFSTYNDKRLKAMKFEDGMQLLEHWLQNFAQHMKETHVRIEFLKNRPIEPAERLQMFGRLYELAAQSNAGMEVNAPLNITECNRMLNASIKGISAQEIGKVETAWDLTNWCTSVLKPQTSDMTNVLSKNNVMNDFILHEIGYN